MNERVVGNRYSVGRPHTPRFGWHDHGHRSITSGAITLMPESSFKHFLNKHQDTVHVHNDFKDMLYPGMEHALCMESLGNHLPRPNDSEKTWDKIQARFTKEARKQYLHKWHQNPPKPENVSSAPSLLSEIQNAARKIYTQLKQLKKGLTKQQKHSEVPYSPKERELFKSHLLMNVGELTHLVADAHMPLHTTRFHNWPMAGPSTKRIHQFLEGDVYQNESDYPAVKEEDANKLSMISKSKLQSFMLDRIKSSFLKVFTLVKKQKKVWEQYPVDVTQQNVTPAYEEDMIQAFKPVLNKQVHQARHALASILHSIWFHAGKPELPKDFFTS